MLGAVLGAALLLHGAGSAVAQPVAGEQRPSGAIGLNAAAAGTPQQAPPGDAPSAEPVGKRPRSITYYRSGSAALSWVPDSAEADLGVGLERAGGLSLGLGGVPGLIGFGGLSLGIVIDDAQRSVNNTRRDVRTLWYMGGPHAGIGMGFTVGGTRFLLLTATSRQRFVYHSSTDSEPTLDTSRSGWLTTQRFAIYWGGEQMRNRDDFMGGVTFDVYRDNDIGVSWMVGMSLIKIAVP